MTKEEARQAAKKIKREKAVEAMKIVKEWCCEENCNKDCPLMFSCVVCEGKPNDWRIES